MFHHSDLKGFLTLHQRKQTINEQHNSQQQRFTHDAPEHLVKVLFRLMEVELWYFRSPLKTPTDQYVPLYFTYVSLSYTRRVNQ